MDSTGGAPSASRRRWMWIAVAVFAFLHWDFWLWDDRSLWFGFLPAGLGYHALYSVAAGLLWMLYIRVAWPAEIEEWARTPPGERAPSERNAP